MLSQADTLVDAEYSNTRLYFDRNGPGSTLGANGDRTSFARSPQMVSPNRTPSIVHSAGDDDHQESSAAMNSSTRSTQSRGKLLRIPGDGERPHVEHSIWDWDAHSESLRNASSSYYFEPQGELLHEQREQRAMRNKFTIPNAVNSSGMSLPSLLTKGSNDSDGFAVPRVPLKRKSESDQSPSTSRPAGKRMSRIMSESGVELLTASELRTPAHTSRSQSDAAARGSSGPDSADERQGSEIRRPQISVGGGPSTGPRRASTDPSTRMVLPACEVFPIQIGDKLFRLSGASISSDAPSYFSQFFEEQLRRNEEADNVRTLYVDRDPATFEDIALHLKGYHIEPRDGPHFVKLFADAQFFSLPKLTAQLFSSAIYIRIGDEDFQISRDLLSNPGDTPNYFSLRSSIFFSAPSDAFPGPPRKPILRPSPVLPPSIPNRSASTFADLLHVLKGYALEIRSEDHRKELLRDARYFHLKGLEQRLIPHKISYSLARDRSEILIRIEDIRQSGISYVSDDIVSASSTTLPPASSTSPSNTAGPGWIYYQRPYVDSEAYSLIVEIAGEESTSLSLEPASSPSAARMGRAQFHRQTLARITSLFSVIASKMNLPVTQPLGLMMLERGAGVASLPVSPSNTGMSDEKVKIRIGGDADVIVDGKPWSIRSDDDDDDDDDEDDEAGRAGSKRRKQRRKNKEGQEWIVCKAQWRLRMQPTSGEMASVRHSIECVLEACKIEAFSCERSRNAERAFLS